MRQWENSLLHEGGVARYNGKKTHLILHIVSPPPLHEAMTKTHFFFRVGWGEKMEKIPFPHEDGGKGRQFQ